MGNKLERRPLTKLGERHSGWRARRSPASKGWRAQPSPKGQWWNICMDCRWGAHVQWEGKCTAWDPLSIIECLQIDSHVCIRTLLCSFWAAKIVFVFTVISYPYWPPLWPSGQSYWLQIQGSGFDSRHYQIFWEVVSLERGPLSLVSTPEELTEWYVQQSSSVLPVRNFFFFTLFISNQNYSHSISKFADCIYDLKRLIQW
jgi:hypothetical protein